MLGKPFRTTYSNFFTKKFNFKNTNGQKCNTLSFGDMWHVPGGVKESEAF